MSDPFCNFSINSNDKNDSCASIKNYSHGHDDNNN